MVEDRAAGQEACHQSRAAQQHAAVIEKDRLRRRTQVKLQPAKRLVLHARPADAEIPLSLVKFHDIAQTLARL